MKKIFILCFLFLFTGCGEKDFSIFCKKEDQGPGFQAVEKAEVYFRSDDKMTKLVKTYTYSFDDEVGEMSFDAALLSLQSFTKMYSSMNGIEVLTLEDLENKKTIQYIFDFSVLTDDDLKKVGLSRNYLKIMEEYKKTMVCD